MKCDINDVAVLSVHESKGLLPPPLVYVVLDPLVFFPWYVKRSYSQRSCVTPTIIVYPFCMRSVYVDLQFCM